MPASVETIKVRRIEYRVERVKEPHAHLIPVHFVLHSPRGRRYLLVPDRRRHDRLVAIAPMTHFSRYRPTPFGGVWFMVTDDGKLVVAPADA